MTYIVLIARSCSLHFRCYCRLYNPDSDWQAKAPKSFSGIFESFSVCFYTHARSGRGGTCSIQSAPFIFNHAHTAGTVNRQFGMVTKCRKLDARFSNKLKKVFSPLSQQEFRLSTYTLCYPSLQPSNIAWNAQVFNTCTALDTFALIYNKRLFNFSCYCAHRTTSCTL